MGFVTSHLGKTVWENYVLEMGGGGGAWGDGEDGEDGGIFGQDRAGAQQKRWVYFNLTVDVAVETLNQVRERWKPR